VIGLAADFARWISSRKDYKKGGDPAGGEDQKEELAGGEANHSRPAAPRGRGGRTEARSWKRGESSRALLGKTIFVVGAWRSC